MTISSILIRLLILFVDFIAIKFSKKKYDSDVLIVKLDNIGDFIVWLDSAKRFRSAYSYANITLVCDILSSELAEKLPYWNNIIKIDRKQFKKNIYYRYRMIRSIREAGYQLSINPTFSRKIMFDDTIIRATQSKMSIGLAGDNLNTSSSFFRRLSKKWYSKLINSPSLLSEHKPSEHYINNFFAEFFDHSPKEITINSLPSFKSKYSIDPRLEDNYFVIFHGAASFRRMWGLEEFATIAHKVSSRFGLKLVICGGPAEVNRSKTLSSLLKCTFIDLTGSTSLLDLIEVIRNSKFVISNETSAVHIAAAVQTLSFCILGGGNFKRFVPYPESISLSKPVSIFNTMPCYNCNWNCTVDQNKAKPYPCISSITPSQLLEEIEKYYFDSSPDLQ